MDFVAGYVSGAAAILIGNPLDVLKVKIQSSSQVSKHCIPPAFASAPIAVSLPSSHNSSRTSPINTPASAPQITPSRPIPHAERTLLKGIAAPLLTYGALNALLYATYNRSLPVFSTPPSHIEAQSGLHIDIDSDATQIPSHSYTYPAHFASGILAGLATFIISAPTELVKCRAQIATAHHVYPLTSNHIYPPTSNIIGSSNSTTLEANRKPPSSYAITKQILQAHGIKGLYHGGLVTSLRDAIGYGFYFLTYEASKDAWTAHAASRFGANGNGEAMQGGFWENEQLKILICGGLAGVATWASIFPLDVIKSRVQTHPAFLGHGDAYIAGGVGIATGDRAPLLGARLENAAPKVPSSWSLAREAVRTEGWMVLFRGLGVCSVRAFIVNAVQWSVYELVMKYVSNS